MKAIYQGVRYHEAKLENDNVVLIDGPEVSLSDPDLVVDPTDGEWDSAREAEPNDIYNETDIKTIAPGMYLGLFHGRNDPKEDLDDWGFNGPIIGPLLFCHTTYKSNMKLRFTSKQAHDRFFPVNQDLENEILEIDGDLVKYHGKYYGDWSVFIAPDCAL